MTLRLEIIAARYAVFAAVATAANLGAQEAAMRAYAGFGRITASILVGTAVGFAVKYVLDKRYIFFDRTVSPAHEVRKIALYGMTAVATTAVFWSFELGCWAMWQTAIARYSGAAIGLAMGYAAKYRLDRRFVFLQGALECP